MSTCLPSRSRLALFFFLLWDRLNILRLESAELCFFGLKKSLVPHDNIVKLLACDKNIVELLESFVLLVHHAQDPQTIALDLLNKVTV